jgi:hypothetical protein
LLALGFDKNSRQNLSSESGRSGKEAICITNTKSARKKQLPSSTVIMKDSLEWTMSGVDDGSDDKGVGYNWGALK